MPLAEPMVTEQPRCGMLRSSQHADDQPESPAMDTTTPLDAAMDRRRIELGYEWGDIASQAGVSTAFLRGLRKGGKGARDLTKAKLEDALQWKRGSIDIVLAGGQPTPADNPIPTLGDLLVQRGIMRPDELTPLEDIRDPAILDVLAQDEMTDQARDDFLRAYMLTRRRVFETPSR